MTIKKMKEETAGVIIRKLASYVHWHHKMLKWALDRGEGIPKEIKDLLLRESLEAEQFSYGVLNMKPDAEEK